MFKKALGGGRSKNEKQDSETLLSLSPSVLSAWWILNKYFHSLSVNENHGKYNPLQENSCMCLLYTDGFYLEVEDFEGGRKRNPVSSMPSPNAPSLSFRVVFLGPTPLPRSHTDLLAIPQTFRILSRF